nr:hypothetical protein [Tanacetum cinerariifolium]
MSSSKRSLVSDDLGIESELIKGLSNTIGTGTRSSASKRSSSSMSLLGLKLISISLIKRVSKCFPKSKSMSTIASAKTLVHSRGSVISTIPARETDEFIKSSVDDLVPIPRESEVTSDSVLECDMPATTPLSPTDDGEDISSLDPPESTLVIDESTLLVTLPLPCTDALGDAIVDIDLLLGEHLDTLSTGDREIYFNPSRDIEELERLLADDPVPIPKVFDEPLNNSDLMPGSSKTSDLFEELIAEFGLDDSIPPKIYDRYHDSEGDILYFEQLLNEDTSFYVSPALLPTESSSLDLPLLDTKQIFLREVERFDPFFSLT